MNFRGLIFLVFAVALPFLGASQFDYYNWKDFQVTQLNIRVNSEFVVDDVERIYFIDASDGLIHNYHSSFSGSPVLNPSSVEVKTGSHIELVGSAIYYIGIDDKIHRLEWDPAFKKWVAFTYPTDEVASAKGFTVNHRNHIFYIKSGSNRISNYWNNGVSQGDSELNLDAPVAITWSNLEFVDDYLYFVDIDNGLSYLTPTSTINWGFGSKVTHKILDNSEIHAINKDQVFYLTQSNDVANYYYNGQSNYSKIQYAPKADGNTQFYATESELFYVGNDDLLYLLFWNGCRWIEQCLNESQIAFSSKFSISSSIQSNGSLFYMGNNSHVKVLRKPAMQTDFVYKRGDKLQMNGADYATNGLCYFARVKYDVQSEAWYIGPHFSSRPLSTNQSQNPNAGICFNQVDCDFALNEHLALIKSLGFDMIRFTDIETDLKENTPGLDKGDKSTFLNYSDNNLYMKYEKYPSENTVSGVDVDFQIVDQSFEPTLFNLYDKLLDAAANNDLKVNFYVGLEHIQRTDAHHAAYLDYVGRFADRFKNRSEIAFYTVAFETSVEANIQHKGYICDYLGQIYDRIRVYDKNHLITAGTFNQGDVRNWDPGIFKVDLLTFHLYPSGASIKPDMYDVGDRYLNWFKNIMNEKIRKPWIIGETGSLSYYLDNFQTTTQTQFANYTIANAFGCGASGHVWFNFADLTAYVPSIGWTAFHGLYPFLNKQGKPIIANHTTFHFTPEWQCNGNCPIPINYFNIDNSLPYSITGTVLDDLGNPIKDAVISGVGATQGDEWTDTFTDEFGSYELTSNKALARVDIASVGKNVVNRWAGAINYDSEGNASLGEITLLDVICSFDPDEDNIRGKKSQSIYSTDLLKELKIYPNPAQNELYITLNKVYNSKTKISIADLSGKKVFEKTLDMRGNFSTHRVDLDLPAGTYVVSLSGYENFTEKLIVQ